MPSQQSFIEYWNACDDLLEAQFCLKLKDGGIDPHEVANAQEALWTAQEFVDWFALKHDLTPRGGAIDLATQARIRRAAKAKE